jgi:glycosidase
MAHLCQESVKSTFNMKIVSQKSFILLLFIAWGAGFKLSAQSPEIHRIDPPHWWVGFSNPRVELLVAGTNLGDVVEVQAQGVRLLEEVKTPNPNYRRVVLDITQSAQPQTIGLLFKNGKRKTLVKYQLKARNYANKTLMGLNPADFIYLITPDRFANGNPANDVVKGMNEAVVNRDSAYYRHGGDIAGIAGKLDYIKDLGATALWINPLLENNQPKASYHGYAITDHYKTDPRFGTNEDFRQLVNTMHSKGLKMVMDVIYNHWGNEHYLHKNLPDSAMVHWFDDGFTQTNYRSSTLHDPYASKLDTQKMTDGWFDKHMPDLDQTNATMANYLIQNSIWWIEEFGIDAYRIDTYAYPDQGFMSVLAERILKEYPNFFLFGETWVHVPQEQNFFIQKNKNRMPFNSNLQSVTDFQWYFALEKGIHEKTEWVNGLSRMYYVLSGDYLYDSPQNLVTFVDNHDLARWYGHCGEDFEKWKIGIGLLLTSRGIPQLYYGTEVLMKATNGHGEIREDFWGGWPGDTINKFTPEGRTALENQAYNYIQKLATFRRNSQALTFGNLTQFTPQDGVYSYIRHAKNGEKVLVFVNNNKEAAPIIDMKRYAELVAVGTRVRNLESGNEFPLPAEMLIEYGISILEVVK